MHEAELIREYLGAPEDIIDCPTEAQRTLFGPQRRRVPKMIDPGQSRADGPGPEPRTLHEWRRRQAKQLRGADSRFPRRGLRGVRQTDRPRLRSDQHLQE